MQKFKLNLSWSWLTSGRSTRILSINLWDGMDFIFIAFDPNAKNGNFGSAIQQLSFV